MIKLRYHQVDAVDAAVKFFRSVPSGKGVVALPTGSGKTYAIADTIKQLKAMGVGKIVVLSHVKEILEQNHKSLERYLGREVSLNSSMLNRREVGDITVAGIQSVYRSPEQFADTEVVIIDEAHLINVEKGTMYQKFFDGIGEALYLGYTATPFRLGTGYIFGDGPDAFFEKRICDWCTKEKFQKLVDDGFLSKLTTKRTKLEMDTSGIKMVGGDFSDKQLSERFDRDGVTNDAIKEIIAAGVNRDKWLIFAIDIDHSEHIAEMLIRNGIPTAPVHSKMGDSGFNREDTLDAHRNGKYKCVVNVNILTTGFDDTGVDLIGVLRPTSSPALHVQINGRGSRTQPGKSDCLVLDFAGNTARLGPVNDVVVHKKKKVGEGGEPITKTCPKCDSILHPSVRICPDCGHKFKFEHNLSAHAANIEIMDDGKAHWIPVTHVTYEANRKAGMPSSVKAIYHCGGRKISEWICVEHKGAAKQKADHWVKYRGGSKCNTIHELLDQCMNLKTPREIYVKKQGKYYVIGDARGFHILK